MRMGAPAGRWRNARLNTLSWIRVAMVSRSSCGALTSENVWRVASVVPCSSSSRSIARPGLKRKPSGLVK